MSKIDNNMEMENTTDNKKAKKSKGKRSTLSKVLIIIFLIVAIVSAWKLGTILYDYWQLRHANNKAAELAYKGEFTGDIDFDKLREENPDVVGWIYHKSLKINLPIVQTDNNDTYLKKRFDGTWGGGGTIFVDCNVANPFNDFSTIVYGHHMKDGSMFAPFKKFKDSKYGKKHRRFELITPDAKYHLDTVAFLNIAADDELYVTNITDAAYKASYCDKIKSKASYTTGVEFGPNDKIVLLSTCAYEFKNARWVIVGKLVPYENQ